MAAFPRCNSTAREPGPDRWIRTAPLALAAVIVAAVLPWAAWASGGSSPKAVAPDGHEFRLEIASTPEERARGYMYRSRVTDEEGMLFIFPQSDFHAFWMKNCQVSLDILWLSDDFTVVYLQEKVPPCRRDPCPSYPPMSRARYVLEIASGMAKKTHLQVGEKLRLSGIDLEKASPPP